MPGGEVAVTDGQRIVLADGAISINVGELRSGRPRKAGAAKVVGTPQALALDGDRVLVDIGEHRRTIGSPGDPRPDLGSGQRDLYIC